MSLAGFRTMMAAADETLRELFPASIRIAGTTYAASGVGGSATSAFLEGGLAQAGTRYFKVDKTAMPARPADGATVEWLDATGPVSRFRLHSVPDRPQETSWTLVCEPYHA